MREVAGLYWFKCGGAPHLLGHTATLFAYSRPICPLHADRQGNILVQLWRCASLFGAHCRTFCVLPPHLLPPCRPPRQYTGSSGAVRLTFRGTLSHFLRTLAPSAHSTPTPKSIYWFKCGGAPHFSGHTAALFAYSRPICSLHADYLYNILYEVGRCASLFRAHCHTFCVLLPHLLPPRRLPTQYTVRSGTVRLTFRGTLPHFLRTPAPSAPSTPAAETIYCFREIA
jgi:hypothetical protein